MSIVDPVCSCGHQEDEHDIHTHHGVRYSRCLTDGCPCELYDPAPEGTEDEDP